MPAGTYTAPMDCRVPAARITFDYDGGAAVMDELCGFLGAT
jgi:hypothetical protein